MSEGNKLPEGVAQQLADVQEHLLAAQEELARKTVTGEAGDGAVKIVLSGNQICMDVVIDPGLAAGGDVVKLQELVLAAMNIALNDSRTLALQNLGPLSLDMDEE